VLTCVPYSIDVTSDRRPEGSALVSSNAPSIRGRGLVQSRLSNCAQGRGSHRKSWQIFIESLARRFEF
jgi:hypothetical protein